MEPVIYYLICSILIFAPIANGYSILVLTPECDSHVSYMSGVAKGCVEAGIDVSFVLSSAYSEREVRTLEKDGMSIIRFKSKRLQPFYKESQMMQFYFFNLFLAGQVREAIAFTTTLETEDVWEMMDDEHFMATIKKRNFDLVVIDGFSFAMARFILPYKLSLPYVVVTSIFTPWMLRIPALPSFVPLVKVPYTEKMSFSQRLHNTKLFLEASPYQLQANYTQIFPPSWMLLMVLY